MADDNTSFIVIAIFVILFFAFINTQPEYSGAAITDDISALSIVIAIVVVIAVLGSIFFILRRIKRRKLGNMPVPPKPGNLKAETNVGIQMPSAPGISGMTKVPSPGAQNSQTQNTMVFDNVKLNEEELSSLFKETPIKEEKKEPVKEEAPEPEKRVIEEKTLANLSELKNLISRLLGKNYSKEQITKFLQSKGWSGLQISKAVEELNNDNLRKYIKEAKQIGMNNDQIIKSLLENGWKIDVIRKILGG